MTETVDTFWPGVGEKLKLITSPIVNGVLVLKLADGQTAIVVQNVDSYRELMTLLITALNTTVQNIPASTPPGTLQ